MRHLTLIAALYAVGCGADGFIDRVNDARDHLEEIAPLVEDARNRTRELCELVDKLPNEPAAEACATVGEAFRDLSSVLDFVVPLAEKLDATEEEL